MNSKAMLLKKGKKKKAQKSSDQKLIETYGGELVDLTDLTAWGDFDTEYQEPKGKREYNRMMKKVVSHGFGRPSLSRSPSPSGLSDAPTLARRTISVPMTHPNG